MKNRQDPSSFGAYTLGEIDIYQLITQRRESLHSAVSLLKEPYVIL